MREIVLEYIIKLFAYIAKLNRESDPHITRFFVKNYLENQYSDQITTKYLELFDNELSRFRIKKGRMDKKQQSMIAVKIIKICETLNQELDLNQRLLILLKFIELNKYTEVIKIETADVTQSLSDIVETISRNLNIDEVSYKDCVNFIFDSWKSASTSFNFVMIAGDEGEGPRGIKKLKKKNLNGNLIFLWIDAIKTFIFKYDGNEILSLNGHPVFKGNVYVFGNGSNIKAQNMEAIYYNDLHKLFLVSEAHAHVHFNVDEISFAFRKSNEGIKKFSFNTESGELLGILGVSGAGKSTLLNMLSGRKKPDEGTVKLNGHDLYDSFEELNGVIGFVPQDDQLFENLTVYQNLYYNAKLCFNNLSDNEIDELIFTVLKNLDLVKIKDLKVGNSLEKIISGGERKRLNLALELLREPPVLMLDEPTSGLSSKDAEKIMDQLKEQSLKGRLVILSIHQPSSEIFKLLDKVIILDTGGYPVYYGEPLEAISYFKESLELVGSSEVECSSCGSINPDQVFSFIESNVVNEYGELSGQRRVEPETWYEKFRDKFKSENVPGGSDEIPEINLDIPNKFKQFIIFSARNFLSKIVDRGYIIVSLVITPVLAVILSLFTKYDSVEFGKYSVFENVNLPTYLFMGVIVALFMGLIVSAEEFFSDRKIRERERFLKFNISSYIHSKVLFLFFLSVIQAASFVFIGNMILSIKGMFLNHFIILLNIFVFANLLGLLISSWFKSIVTIYILIPLLLIPQLLLSGAIIDFDKLNSKFTNQKYVPVVADIMASRWAYEALLVTQYRDNKYQKNFFEIEREISNVYYKSAVLIPELMKRIDIKRRHLRYDNELLESDLNLIKKELETVSVNINLKFDDNVELDKYQRWVLNEYKKELNKLLLYNNKVLELLKREKNRIFDSVLDQVGGIDGLKQLKEDHYNKTLADYVLNNKSYTKIIESGGRLIRKFEPVYQPPVSKFGRSHFMSSSKRIFSIYLNTMLFNNIIILLMSLIIYIILVVTLPRVTIKQY